MRVSFIVNNYPPRVGGVENHVAALAKQLVRAGHEVGVHTLSERSQPPILESGVEVTRWREWFRIGGLLGFPTLAAAWGMVRHVLADRPDIISVHTRFFPLTWMGAAIGRCAGIPVVHTEHGSDHVASPSPVITWGSKAVDWTLGRASLRSARVVLGVSREVVSFVRRLAGVRAEVFHNAIDLPPVEARSVRRHVVFVGRIVPGKGWEDFLNALGSLPDDVTAEVLGDGPDMAALQKRAAALGWGDRLIVRGRVPLGAVYEGLAGAVLVNPTRLSEGFQTTLLEALSVGGRVVTYPVPGAETLREEGAPVSVVADVDSLSAALNAELECPGGRWPADRVAEWAWPRRAAEYVGVLRRVIGEDQSKS